MNLTTIKATMYHWLFKESTEVETLRCRDKLKIIQSDRCQKSLMPLHNKVNQVQCNTLMSHWYIDWPGSVRKICLNETGIIIRILAPDSSKIASRSSRLTFACSKLGDLYPFLTHSFSMTLAIVNLYFKP